MALILPTQPASGKPKLLDQVHDAIRLRHYSIRTEQAYTDWIKRFILFHDKRHPREMGEEEVSQFLTYLARHDNVAASTQNQALSALLFLYKEVLKQEIGWLKNVERAKKPPKLPVVLSPAEVRRIFAHLRGVEKLMAGASLRQRSALDGMRSVASEGCRFRLRADHGAGRKRRQRSCNNVTAESRRTAETPRRQSKDTARAGLGGRLWKRAFAFRPGAKIP